MEGIILLSIIAFAATVPPTTTAQYMNLSPTKPNQISETNYKLFQRFDVELLKRTVQKNSGNVLISPFSIKQILAMVLEGAGGGCADELREALRLNANSKDDVRNQFNHLIEQFKRDSSINTLKIANKIFLTDKQRINKSFKNTLERYYNASIELCNFVDNYQSAKDINDWVKDETEGLISNIIEKDSLGPQTSLILTNALYFKGLWERDFDVKNTRVRCFKNSENNCHVKTYMMEISNTYNYYKSRELDAQVLEMPYRDNIYSMVIFLPNKINGLTKMIKEIPYDYHHAINNLEMTEVTGTIPRFRIEFADDMQRTLEDLDIKQIFTEVTANLSGIIEDKSNLFVSNVFHKAVIDVNEKGTVAAAATGAVVIPLMGGTNPVFTADHPFVFFIRHIPTGTILFAGHVVEPTIARESEPQRELQIPLAQRYKEESAIVFDQHNEQYDSQAIPPQANLRQVAETPNNNQYNQYNNQNRNQNQNQNQNNGATYRSLDIDYNNRQLNPQYNPQYNTERQTIQYNSAVKSDNRASSRTTYRY